MKPELASILRRTSKPENKSEDLPILFFEKDMKTIAVLVSTLVAHEIQAGRMSDKRNPSDPFDEMAGQVNRGLLNKKGIVFLGEHKIRLITEALERYAHEKQIDTLHDPEARELFVGLGIVTSRFAEASGVPATGRKRKDNSQSHESKPGLMSRFSRRRQ